MQYGVWYGVYNTYIQYLTPELALQLGAYFTDFSSSCDCIGIMGVFLTRDDK